MALYAFDGAWNEDEIEDDSDTNVVRFSEQLAMVGGNCFKSGKTEQSFKALFSTMP